MLVLAYYQGGELDAQEKRPFRYTPSLARSSNSQEKQKPRFSKHLSLVEKIVEELLRPLKMSDGLLRIGHPNVILRTFYGTLIRTLRSFVSNKL
jgi:hypothetical protein